MPVDALRVQPTRRTLRYDAGGVTCRELARKKRSSVARKVARGDDGMDRLADVMSDSAVRSFFHDFFGTWSDAKAALLMMYVYVSIDEEYAKQTGERMTPTDVAAIMRKMFANSQCRHVLVDAMADFMDARTAQFDVKSIAATNKESDASLSSIEWHQRGEANTMARTN